MVVRQAPELLERATLAKVGDGDVEAVVDDRLAFALAVPDLERLGECLSLALDAEVDVRCRAAERRGRLPRLEVVDRRLAAPGHLEVRVRVDGSRQDVLAGRVDDLVRLNVERLADQGDALSVDEHVGDVVVSGGDHAAALDQHGHRRSFRGGWGSDP